MAEKINKKYTMVLIESRLRDLTSREVKDFLEKANALDQEMNVRVVDKPEDYVELIKDKKKIDSINVVILGKYEPVIMGNIERIIFDLPPHVELGTIIYYGWNGNKEKANTIKEIITEIQSFKKKYSQRESVIPAGMPELQLS